MKKQNKKGFTIVELVIVIAIIAILAAVLIPTYSTVTEKAKKSSALQEAKAAQTLAVSELGTGFANQDMYICSNEVWYKFDGAQGTIDELSETPAATLLAKATQVYAKTTNGPTDYLQITTVGTGDLAHIKVTDKATTPNTIAECLTPSTASAKADITTIVKGVTANADISAKVIVFVVAQGATA